MLKDIPLSVTRNRTSSTRLATANIRLMCKMVTSVKHLFHLPTSTTMAWMCIVTVVSAVINFSFTKKKLN